MSVVSNNIKRLAAEFAGKKRRGPKSSSVRLAEALHWTKKGAWIERFSPIDLKLRVTRAFVGSEPAAVFVAESRHQSADLLAPAALFAYHSTIEWGVVADPAQAIIFNSHWIRNGSWFQLPPIRWRDVRNNLGVFESITPDGLTQGTIDEIALKQYKPENQLLPVDDALVDRLDHWRDEAMRHVIDTADLDRNLQTLFAQLFILRAIEDRKLLPELKSLCNAVNGPEVDYAFLRGLFAEAQTKIQSELFDELVNIDQLPAFVLAGIISDLYRPEDLPGTNCRYNFAWIEADVLGRAYEKYLSTLLIPTGRPSTPQLRLWDQPVREVERKTTARKASGVYYTPSFLVRHLTEKCLDEYFSQVDGLPQKLPKIADISCGSGSFLTVAVDALIRRLRQIDSDRNWGRELISRNCIVGIDIDARAVTFARLQLWLRLAEEPKPLPLPRLERTIVHGDSLVPDTWKTLPKECQIILGNPPFIATGDFQSRAELVSRFKTAQGRFDYSYVFVEQAISKLAKSGVLGLVIPNRLFKNKDATALRQLLTDQMELLSITDFGSNEVFSGTSSYIGTFIARKSTKSSLEKSPVRFMGVHDLPSRFVGAMLSDASLTRSEVRNRYLIAYDAPHPVGSYEWLMLSTSARNIRLRLTDQGKPLPEVAGIYQGIRTGGNDIFIVDVESHAAGPIVNIRNGLGDVHVVERDLLRDVIYGSNIQRYDLVKPQKFLLYPYRGGRLIPEADLRTEFPQALRYFETYRSLLLARTSVVNKGKFWYELATQRNEAWLNKKKLIIRDLAVETSFAYDDTGSTFLVGGTAVVPEDESLLLPLLAYLNSSLSNWFLNQITPSFRADFQKFEPKHLESIPVLTEIVEDVGVAGKLTEMALTAIRARADQQGRSPVENEIDKYVCSVAKVDYRDLL